MNRHEKKRVMAAASDGAAALRRMWGNAPLGLRLATAFYEDDPWVTAMEMAEGMEESEDTIRRKLDELAKIGRVKAMKRGRTTVYKAHREWAARSWEIVKSFLLAANCG